MARKRTPGLKLESDDERFRISEEQRKQHERDARKAALALSRAAKRAGAKSVSEDGELDPCGLGDVLDAVFGEEIHLIKKDQ